MHVTNREAVPVPVPTRCGGGGGRMEMVDRELRHQIDQPADSLWIGASSSVGYLYLCTESKLARM